MPYQDELWSAHYQNARRLNLLAVENQHQHHNLANDLNTLLTAVAHLTTQVSALMAEPTAEHQDTKGE